MNESIQLLLNKARELDWNVSEINNGYITFSKFSPAGQDFSFNIEVTDNIEDFIQKIYDYYENYDVSYEAYLWLDNSGHGMNGAPYDIKDLYEDMEACESNVKELYDYLAEMNKTGR